MSHLDFDADPFPNEARYPLNGSGGDQKSVLKWVRRELNAGPTLVVTGFSSLEFLVATLAPVSQANRIRVLIGQEPFHRTSLPAHRLPRLDEELSTW